MNQNSLETLICSRCPHTGSPRVAANPHGYGRSPQVQDRDVQSALDIPHDRDIRHGPGSPRRDRRE